MKQRIELSQITELTKKQKATLREWWIPQEGDCFISESGSQQFISKEVKEVIKNKDSKLLLPLLAVGQMIHFLKEHDGEIASIYHDENPLHDKFVVVRFKRMPQYQHVELCDALWHAVKSALGE